MAIVHSYIRFSTKKQRKGDSKRRQLEDGDAWIVLNKHTPSSKSLVDEGVSAFRGKNAAVGNLGKFLDRIQEGRVKPGEILLIEALDRLSREGIDAAYDTFRRIIRAGVPIVVLKPWEILFDQASLNDPQKLSMAMSFFHLAWMESKNKSDRIGALRRNRREASLKGSGTPVDSFHPSWLTYDRKSRKFSVKPEGQSAISHIFTRTAEGIGQQVLCAELQRDFKPIGRSKKWNTSFVSKVLNDRSVLGERQHYQFDSEHKRVPVGDPIEGYYPTVISEELWFQAQAKKSQKIKQKGPNTKFTNLFTGLLTNAHDGSALHIQTTRFGRKEVGRRLVSSDHTNRVPGADPVSVPYLDFEAAVLRQMTELKVTDLESRVDLKEIKKLDLQLVGVVRRIAELQEALGDPNTTLSVKHLMTSINSLETQKTDLESQIRTLNASLHSPLPLQETQSVLAKLRETDKDSAEWYSLRMRLRGLIAELVESIFVKPEKHHGKVFALIQLNYRSGLFRQCDVSPISRGYTIRQTSIEEFRLDLRDRKAANSLRFFAGHAMLLDRQEVPDISQVEIPTTLGKAANLWLSTKVASKANLRVLRPKIQRFVEFLGADQVVAEISERHWDLWVRHLKIEVAERRFSLTTTRITHQRSREFLKFLVDNKRIEHFASLDISGARAFPD